jgi:hypothetical protein
MRRSTVLLAIMAIVIAGCGAESDPEAAAAASADSSDDEESLADFFGYAEEDPEAAEANYREQEVRVQESIRSCMAAAGFEYQPINPPEGSFGFVDEEWDEGEWVREQGFGITTWYGNEEEFTETTVEGEEWTDPNQEMLDAMSEPQREAWYAALYGTEEEQMEDSYTEVDPETGEEYTVMEGHGAGCQGEAYTAEYGEQTENEDLWEELSPAMDAMYQQIQADPRIVELDQEWSTCMGSAGYEYESMNTMHETVHQDFQTRFDAIVGPNGGYTDPFEGWTQEEIDSFFEEKSEEEIEAFFSEAEQTTRDDIDMDALAALQQEEIDLAVADFECRDGYWETYQEVTEDYEADFIAANREILEQIKESQGG